MADKEDKNLGGRPSKYEEKFCEDIIEFFSIEHTKIVDGKEVANSLPTFERFSVQCGVNRCTLREWCDKHEMFSTAYKKAQELQKDMLMDLGMRGLYNPTFTIFTAKNITDMKDKIEVDNTNKNVEIKDKGLVKSIIKDLDSV